MKYLLLFLSFASLLACTKKEKATTSNSDSTSTAQVNGAHYSPSVTRASWQGDKTHLVTIAMEVKNSYGIERNSIVLFDILPTKGKSKVVSSMKYIGMDKYVQRNDDSCKAYFFLSDGDATENVYYVNETAPDNYIDIEKYDATISFMSGKFNLTLYRERPNEKPQTQGFPDTLRITDGRFE
jgi:hypothetical protein